MGRGFFITGTDTGVGKTVVTAGLILTLKTHRKNPRVMKPLASGCVRRGGKLLNEDTLFLAKAMNEQICFDAKTICSKTHCSGDSMSRPYFEKQIQQITPFLFEKPLAPYPASQMERKKISLNNLRKKIHHFTAAPGVPLIEGAGGLLVPITRNYFIRDLICDSNLPVILVGRLGLGTINHTLMTVELLQKSGVKISGVILNETVPQKKSIAAKTNPKVLAALLGKVPLLGVLPWIPGLSIPEGKFGKLRSVFEKNISLKTILRNI